jgi:hypothetical protein
MTFMSTTGQAPVPAAGARGPFGALRMTPGRWLALAIGVPVALTLIGWTGFSLVTTVARGSYPFSYVIPVDNGQTAVNVTTGNVTLRETPGGKIARLTGIVQYGLISPSISENTTSGGANIGMNCDGIDTDCGMSATLDVPARTAVTLWSNGGDISASDFSSGTTLWAQGGNVTAASLTGDVHVDTGGGDLTATGLAGTLLVDSEGGNINAGNWTSSHLMQVDTGGGDLTVNGLSGDLQLNTEGGNVEASGMASDVADMNSGGGDVTLTLTQAPQNLQIIAEGGNVTVVLPPGGQKYDISTPGLDGGNPDIPSSLVDPASPDKISINSGGGDVTVSQGPAGAS